MSDTPQTEVGKHAAPAKNRIVVWMIALPVVIFGALMLVGQFMDRLDPAGLDASCADALGPIPLFIDFNGASP